MNQSPPPPPPHQHLPNGFPYGLLSPAVLNDTHLMPVNLPSSIDVDQTLSNAISSLNLSQRDRWTFLPHTLDNEHGGVGSPIGGEGFIITPFRSNSSSVSLEESLRVSNADYQRTYFGVAHPNPLPIDHLPPHQHYPCPLQISYNREFLQGSCSSGFDPRFDFDQRSYLLSKQRLYSTQQLNSYHNRCSLTPAVGTLDQSLLGSSNFFMSRDNICHSNNHSCDGMSDKLQNQQFLSLLPLKELRGMVYFLAKDQNGCRILQSKFENPTKDEIDLVLSEVVGSIADLMKDQFGNYLIQKLVSVCNDDQKTVILRELTEGSIEIILVSVSPYGTRAIQKLLENLKDPNQIMMVIRALHCGAAKLANDPNGHHVLQYCLLHFDSDFNQLILDEIADNCFKVATDRSGCCVLQACVEHSRGKARNRLIAEIMANAIHIAEDPFGNYVLQHMVGLKLPDLTQLLVRQLQGNFASLSRNKYASNVVEKCLIESGPEISTNIILELVGSPNPSLLLVDPYGNFVIQSALKVSKGFAHECLRKLISRNVTAMQSNLYGKKILEKIEKRRIMHI
ncbi:Armadillo-like helical [Cynara cardunculus var. scolymus]|uniref:Armadillo-like helical n=1 Tax=Cynara cardunculus var. scolymus TaxID=59895 RepID=A0A118JSH9_CYNCS|nr:Armadillo-like helical [Cynara cardunculus var. scolymus]